MDRFARAQAGDPNALAALVREHMPLVQSLSKRFSFCEDAFQMGCMGLVQAIRRFKQEKNCRFSTYAVPWILGEMRRAFSRTLGWRTQGTLRRAQAFQEKMIRETGREPSICAMAQAAGTTPEELILLLEADQPTVSYDAEEFPLPAFPDPQSERWLERFFIRDILQRLPSGDGWLLLQRFGAGRSQSELAGALRISQSSISRREQLARQRFIAQWTIA